MDLIHACSCLGVSEKANTEETSLFLSFFDLRLSHPALRSRLCWSGSFPPSLASGCLSVPHQVLWFDRVIKHWRALSDFGGTRATLRADLDAKVIFEPLESDDQGSHASTRLAIMEETFLLKHPGSCRFEHYFRKAIPLTFCTSWFDITLKKWNVLAQWSYWKYEEIGWLAFMVGFLVVNVYVLFPG